MPCWHCQRLPPSSGKRRFDQPPAATPSAGGRLEEQRRDVVAGEPHEADGRIPRVGEHPELERVVGEGLRHVRAQPHDVLLREEIVRRSH